MKNEDRFYFKKKVFFSPSSFFGGKSAPTLLNSMNTPNLFKFNQKLLTDADLLVCCIQETLSHYDPYNYYDHLIPPPDHISLSDCDIPDSVQDPFAIIRHVRGEATAQRMQYEDDLEIIMQEIEECKAELTRTCNVQGDAKGKEQTRR